MRHSQRSFLTYQRHLTSSLNHSLGATSTNLGRYCSSSCRPQKGPMTTRIKQSREKRPNKKREQKPHQAREGVLLLLLFITGVLLYFLFNLGGTCMEGNMGNRAFNGKGISFGMERETANKPHFFSFSFFSFSTIHRHLLYYLSVLGHRGRYFHHQSFPSSRMGGQWLYYNLGHNRTQDYSPQRLER